MPNSRFALHGVAPSYFTVCELFLPLVRCLCAFLRPLLTRVSTAPRLALQRFTRLGPLRLVLH